MDTIGQRLRAIEAEMQAIKELEKMTKEEYLEQLVKSGAEYEPKSVRIERLKNLILSDNMAMVHLSNVVSIKSRVA